MYTGVSGSPFANSNMKQFTPPGTNQAGDGDWVLVLEASTNGPRPGGRILGGLESPAASAMRRFF
jgi:hypothetical protein